MQTKNILFFNVHGFYRDIVKQFKTVNVKFKVKIRTISSLCFIGFGVKTRTEIWNLSIFIFFIPSAAVKN